MTNAKVYQGFHDDKKVEEHWYIYTTKQFELSEDNVKIHYDTNHASSEVTPTMQIHQHIVL